MSFLNKWFKRKEKAIDVVEGKGMSGKLIICTNCGFSHYTRVCPTAPDARFDTEEWENEGGSLTVMDDVTPIPDEVFESVVELQMGEVKDGKVLYPMANPNFEPDLNADFAEYREEYGDPSFHQYWDFWRKLRDSTIEQFEWEVKL